MSILILGSDGFIGKNLKYFLKHKGFKIFEYTRKNKNDLKEKIKKSKFIIHLADKIKSTKKSDYYESTKLIDTIVNQIKQIKKKKYIIYTSSKNINQKKDLHYSLKKENEKILKSSEYIKTFILRLPNIFGKWCKPNYNSFFTTACYNISINKKIEIKSQKKYSLLHVSDLCEHMLNIITQKKIDKKFIKNRLINLSPLDIKNILQYFKSEKKINLLKEYNLTKEQYNKIYSTYLFYSKRKFNVEKFKKIKDFRGDFSELVKDNNFGQISLLTVNPKQERGNHFHDFKIEKFFVISGKGRLVHQNILNNKIIKFDISDTISRVYTSIPGWSHKIQNFTKNKLIILIWSNEVYDKKKPDTIKWTIKQ